MTIKEIAEEKYYLKRIKLIKDYARQKVKERDGQWDNALARLKYDFCQEDLIEIVESLPEPKFE